MFIDSGDVYSWGLSGPYLGVQPSDDNSSSKKKPTKKDSSDQNQILQPPMKILFVPCESEDKTAETDENNETKDENKKTEIVTPKAIAVSCGMCHSLVLTGL